MAPEPCPLVEALGLGSKTVGELIEELGLEAELPAGCCARLHIGSAALAELPPRARPKKHVPAVGVLPAHRATIYAPSELETVRRHIRQAAADRATIHGPRGANYSGIPIAKSTKLPDRRYATDGRHIRRGARGWEFESARHAPRIAG